MPALYRFRHTLGARKLVIELATADDARPLLDIFRACLSEGRWFVSHADELPPDDAWLKRMIDDLASRSKGVALVARLDKVLVGGLTIRRGDLARTAHVGRLEMFLSPEARGLGVGKALLDAGITWATEHPTVRKLSLSVFDDNAAGVRLYEGRGFGVEGRRPLEYREDDGSLRGDILMARAT